MASGTSFAEKRRLLQLETLYDLAVSLHAHRPEQELVDELLQRVCAVLDPAAAVAVTRDTYGAARAVACVGWPEASLDGDVLLRETLWRELLASGESLARHNGEYAERRFRELVAVPFSGRGVFLGYLAVFDKEERGGETAGFTGEDRRFLDSVAALAGVALDSARQVQDLEVERQKLEEENRALKGRLTTQLGEQKIVAHTASMRRVLERVERVAPRSVSVVVRGDSGTGKELIAKLLHLLSGRRGPLVAVNCAALPESLLESELFGIERGVATGVEARRGKFELAHTGTLFLDEIGDLDLVVQVKLLRALQEREIVRVGGDRPTPVDVRLVAATHRDLEALVADGRFREDLYYRLKGVEVVLPPLRDRREDIPHLVRLFAGEFAEREGLEPVKFDSGALALLMAHDFPGNVRELQNVVEAALSLTDARVDAELVHTLLRGTDDLGGGPEALELAAMAKRHIARVLKMTGGNKSRAAELLGVDRRTLQRRGF
jgi:transcriptional regulator with GAF, ATPase, and Fis domain